jgi:hypothetical protein
MIMIYLVVTGRVNILVCDARLTCFIHGASAAAAGGGVWSNAWTALVARSGPGLCGTKGVGRSAWSGGRRFKASDSDILGEIGDLARHHAVAGKPEDVADTMAFAEGDGFDAAVVAVAADQDLHVRPAGAEARRRIISANEWRTAAGSRGSSMQHACRSAMPSRRLTSASSSTPPSKASRTGLLPTTGKPLKTALPLAMADAYSVAAW